MHLPKRTLLILPTLLVAWPHGIADARSGSKAAGPLAPLVKMGKVLQRAGNAALQGKTTTARGQIDLTLRPRAKQKMHQAGVRSLVLVGMEFELIFRHAGRVTYYLRTFVHPGTRKASLMSFSGRAPNHGKMFVTGKGAGLFRGIAAPFGTAARRLVKSVATRRCHGLATTSPALSKRLGLKGRVAKRMLRNVARARRNRAGVCRALAKVQSHTLSVRIDDVAFIARDARGRLVGLVKGDIRLIGRKLRLSLGAFRAIRP